MADIKISELTQAESLSTSDLLESAVQYNGGFLSRRMSLAQLSNYLENYVQHQALTTTAKTIVSAINEILGDLANYYTTSQTYSKTEVDTLIAGVSGLHFLVVQQLPTTDIDMNTIYLVPKQDSGQQDVYDEYICLDDTTTPATWEKIGTTEIDLSDYVTDTELSTILNDYVTSSGLNTILADYATTSAMTTALADKVDKVSGKGLSTEDYTTAEKTKVNGLATVATSGSYNDLTDKPTIPTNTDEKVKQTAVSSSSNANYRLLLSKSASNTEETDGVQKSGSLYYNPYDDKVTVQNVDISNTANIATAKVTSLITSQYYFNLGSGSAVAMLEANSAATTSSPIFNTLPASSGTLALRSDITSAINDLDVASTSIGQGETLATIKEENGKIAVTKQNIKIGLGQIDNFYRCGTNNAISGSNTWHKVASVTCVPGTNEDDIILLSVMDTYLPDTTDDITDAGILYCRIRQATSGGVDSVNYAELKFVANSGLNPSNFRLYHKTDTNGITFEIWTSMNRRYAWRKFSVISQCDRTSAYSNSWTLYNTTSPTSAPTESATCVRVECKDNTYKQTDNNLLGSKNLLDATNLSRTNQTVTSTYNSDDGTITINGTAGNNGGILENLEQIKIPNLKVGDEIILSLEVISGTFSHTASSATSFFLGKLSDGSSLDGKYASLGSSLSAGDKISCVYEVKSDMIVDGVFTIRSCQIYMRQNDVFNNLKLAIMLRPKSIANDTYNMYSMTNSQLTVSKADYSQIADIEKTTTASRAYAKNELMIWRGALYRVTTAISSGGAISGKVTATTLSAEIKAIRDALNI